MGQKVDKHLDTITTGLIYSLTHQSVIEQNSNELDHNLPHLDDEKKSIEINDTPRFKPKQIISIDFGSFGSTASYCLPESPNKYIVLKRWKGMGTCDSIMQKKTLTALLWNIHKHKTVAFGYEAQTLLWNIHKHKTVAFGYEAQTLYFEYTKIINRPKSSKEKLKKKFGDEHIKLAYFKHFKPHLVGEDPLRKK
eukprot:1104262_1